MQGKYSPTVSGWYTKDQDWFKKNGGGYGNGDNPTTDNDNDGFDSYGYSGDCGDDVDRAGNLEHEYYGDDHLFEDVTVQFYHKPLPHTQKS